MNDILIRGTSVSNLIGKVIEIGYDAADCLYAFVDGGATDILEAIELPEHGDLIDRDAFRDENEYYLNREFINPKHEDTLDDLLKDAPVVIPSNKEGK